MRFMTSSLSLPDEGQRFGATLTGLNERIARLSGALGVILAQEGQLQRVLDRDPALFGAEATRPAATRRRREMEELRGLLVLRCHLMANSLQALGFEAIEHLAFEVEKQMLRDGFLPGADGFELLESFARPEASGQDFRKEKIQN